MSKKLKEIVADQNEFDMIIDLLRIEKRHSYHEEPQTIKKEFQLLIDQHFKQDD